MEHLAREKVENLKFRVRVKKEFRSNSTTEDPNGRVQDETNSPMSLREPVKHGTDVAPGFSGMPP
jgi:hypothetical protein